MVSAKTSQMRFSSGESRTENAMPWRHYFVGMAGVFTILGAEFSKTKLRQMT